MLRLAGYGGALALMVGVAALPSVASAQEPPPKIEIPTEVGSWVVVQTKDATIEGKLLATFKYAIAVETRDGLVSIDRATILAVQVRELRPDTATNADAVTKPPSPWDHWGLWGGISAGAAWGASVGSQGATIEPAAALGFDLAASFYFVYVGVGGVFTFFKGATFSNDTTAGVVSSGTPASGGAYAEAGLTHGIFIPYDPAGRSAIELRPGVGYGYQVMSSVTQTISNCIGCDSRSYDYAAGQYVRAQLGVYLSRHPPGSTRYRIFMARNGFFMGGTVSYQHFLFGSDPALHDALMFGLTTGWGP